ncbi:NAD(P)/FAD-dependent oxidoreductase [Sulfurimonas autotrophica]|uniref:HI0933 family protein n=1 Tax=Sulfurimonas autotrophica (strain ATCC BAA-671 / DSM 16294 / JCM 11897 / OK10) TaxID=563040 RepID=E0UTU5_SULAO|nr:aminoacetone oxidase family FAD-binding enzyme [Sulfurimonas autotrophica]ADN09389.1 HI0933 family protein [Sulfurimonas autotrophica DSM 16294]
MNEENYDLIVVGSGAAGIIAAIIAAREGKKVLLLEKLSKIASKLKATGGGRCNLTNTLSNEDFMARFGRDGRFMQDALNEFDYKKLINFLEEIGIETHAPDGFRVFPTSHSSATIISGLKEEMQRQGITIKCNQKVTRLLATGNHIDGVKTEAETFLSPNIIIATGGLGYPVLGAEGDGYNLASEVGHKITDLSPAMMPLKTKETWVKNCRADTIAKVELRVDIKKHKKLRAIGDLIFTNSGIRGPVVLDFAREVTPLLKKYGEVPLLLNLTKGKNEEQIREHFKKESTKENITTVLELLKTLLPEALSLELCHLAKIEPDTKYKKVEGKKRDKLISLLAWTPLTVTGHDGFKMAMITRGGVSLKEINPKTMQSKIIDGLYFCGEVMNLDGPCGGYNLQWSFASGYLAGKLL